MCCNNNNKNLFLPCVCSFVACSLVLCPNFPLNFYEAAKKRHRASLFGARSTTSFELTSTPRTNQGIGPTRLLPAHGTRRVSNLVQTPGLDFCLLTERASTRAFPRAVRGATTSRGANQVKLTTESRRVLRAGPLQSFAIRIIQVVDYSSWVACLARAQVKE